MSRDKPTHRADASALLDDRGYSGILIRGQNPALLIEKAVRDRITESYYWKEQCFGLNAATLCDRAAELKFVGGTYGTMGKPTPFLCLLFKMLQLTPEKAVVLEYLNFCEDEGEDGEAGSDDEGGIRLVNGDEGIASGPVPLDVRNKRGAFKYLRALAAFYIRLTWEPVEIYNTLEPLLSDYRKLKRRTRDGFTLTYMDQLVDDLLTKNRMFATALWQLPIREQLEDLDMLEPRVSPLGEEVEALDEEMQELEARERGDEEGDLSDGGRDGRRDDRGRYSDEYSDRYSDRSSRSTSRSRGPRSRSRSPRSRSRTPRLRSRTPRSRSRTPSSRRRSYSSDESYRRRHRRHSSSISRGRRRSPRSRSRERNSYDRRSPRSRSRSMDQDERRKSNPRSGTRSMARD